MVGKSDRWDLLPGHISFLNLGFPSCETDSQTLTCPPHGICFTGSVAGGDEGCAWLWFANVREERVERGDRIEG